MRATSLQAWPPLKARDRGRELAQVAGGSADEPGQLAEAPVRRRERLGITGQGQLEAVAVVAARLDPHLAALQDTRPRPVGAVLHPPPQVQQGQEALVGGTREPRERHAAVAASATRIDAVAGRDLGPLAETGRNLLHGTLHDGLPESHSLRPCPVTSLRNPPLTLERTSEQDLSRPASAHLSNSFRTLVELVHCPNGSLLLTRTSSPKSASMSSLLFAHVSSVQFSGGKVVRRATKIMRTTQQAKQGMCIWTAVAAARSRSCKASQ